MKIKFSHFLLQRWHFLIMSDSWRWIPATPHEASGGPEGRADDDDDSPGGPSSPGGRADEARSLPKKALPTYLARSSQSK